MKIIEWIISREPVNRYWVRGVPLKFISGANGRGVHWTRNFHASYFVPAIGRFTWKTLEQLSRCHFRVRKTRAFSNERVFSKTIKSRNFAEHFIKAMQNASRPSRANALQELVQTTSSKTSALQSPPPWSFISRHHTRGIKGARYVVSTWRKWFLLPAVANRAVLGIYKNKQELTTN